MITRAMRSALAVGGVAAVVMALVGYAAFEAGLERGRTSARVAAAAGRDATPSPAPPGIAPSSGRRVLYWHDPMVPGARFDKPGKSPFMDMQLVPVYADDASRSEGVAIEPGIQQSLGIRTAKAVTGALPSAASAVGNVAYNERDVVVLQARSNAFVEKLHVRAALDPVRKRQPLADIYVPDWIAAQEEYLSAKRLRTDVDGLALGGLVDAAAQRMRLAGMTDEQIKEVDARNAVQTRFTITSPIDGVVSELAVREGMTVGPGTMMFRLNGLATVWVNAEVAEGAAGEVRPGSRVEARTPARPGSVFKGRVNAILPEVNATTRTLKARIELANPGGLLVPGMFATIDFAAGKTSDMVLVPSEAVIRTGKRTLVIVARGDGRFAPVEVTTGLDNNGQTEIRNGLRAGDTVVVSGQFLIDSEANLKAATSRMGGAPADTADATHPVQGEVNTDRTPMHDGASMRAE